MLPSPADSAYTTATESSPCDDSNLNLHDFSPLECTHQHEHLQTLQEEEEGVEEEKLTRTEESPPEEKSLAHAADALPICTSDASPTAEKEQSPQAEAEALAPISQSQDEGDGDDLPPFPQPTVSESPDIPEPTPKASSRRASCRSSLGLSRRVSIVYQVCPLPWLPHLR